MRGVALVVSFAVVGLAVSGASASPRASATVRVAGGAIVYTAAPGQTNVLVVAATQGAIRLQDASVAIAPGPGCAPGSFPGEAFCNAGGVSAVVARLGDGNDVGAPESDPALVPSLSFRLDGGAGNDVLGGAGRADVLEGGVGDDTLGGGPGNDVLRGGSGKDTLDGRQGNDVEDGGGGNDTFHQGSKTLIAGRATGRDRIRGGAGADTVWYDRVRSESVRVSLDGRPNDGTGAEGDNVGADVEAVFGGQGHDSIVGSQGANALGGGISGNDSLRGLGGGDVLQGGSENDTLDGGPGKDALQGGEGNDRLLARDGARDLVDCGGGRDTAKTDSLDFVRATKQSRCEIRA